MIYIRDIMSKGFPFVAFLQVKSYSLQWSQSYRYVQAYPGFRALDGMLVHRPKPPLQLHQPSVLSNGNHCYTRVGKGTVQAECLAQEHNTVAKANMSST